MFPGHMYGWNGFGLAGMLFGGLMMLLFWGGLAALVFFGVRWLSRSQGGPAARYDDRPARSADAALDILRERYARGEITKEQYEQMRVDLGAPGPAGR